MRDISDIAHPKTVATLKDVVPAFVSGTELSFTDAGGLVRTPLAGTPKTVVTSQTVLTFAWSPDATAVAYTAINSNSGMDVHEILAGADRAIGSAPSQGVGGCESIAGCAIANSLDSRLAYSSDGSAISLVSSGFGPSAFRVWSSEGKLLQSRDSGGDTMSVWSGNSLYFRDAKGVEVWRDGVVAPFLPGVAWITPRASPAGGQIVYTARDGAGWGHTYVVDTATKKVREIKSARNGAVFLTSRYLWYQGERACLAADSCGATPPFHPLSGTNYIYDLQDATESVSIITSVIDVWPHAA